VNRTAEQAEIMARATSRHGNSRSTDRRRTRCRWTRCWKWPGTRRTSRSRASRDGVRPHTGGGCGSSTW
jgi:hypothetical protein